MTLFPEAVCLLCGSEINLRQAQGGDPCVTPHETPAGTPCDLGGKYVSDAWDLKASLRYVQRKLNALQEAPPGTVYRDEAAAAQGDFQALQKLYQLEADALVQALQNRYPEEPLE